MTEKDLQKEREEIKRMAETYLADEGVMAVLGGNIISNDPWKYGGDVFKEAKKLSPVIRGSEKYRELEKKLSEEKTKNFKQMKFSLIEPNAGYDDVVSQMYMIALQSLTQVTIGGLEKMITSNSGELGVEIPKEIMDISTLDISEEAERTGAVEGEGNNKRIKFDKLGAKYQKAYELHAKLLEIYKQSCAEKIAKNVNRLTQYKEDLKQILEKYSPTPREESAGE